VLPELLLRRHEHREGTATGVISMKNFDHVFSVSQKATAEHEANANTARLRALRLARDAGQDVVLEKPTEVSTARKRSA
jgi:hypothetical protein